MKWHSSAPANLMLMGEHSVVQGFPAMACAINQRLHIYWEKRTDNQLHIHSELGQHQTTIDTLDAHAELNWVMAVLQSYQPHLKHGLNISIKSEFKSTLGFGSSAAIVAAMLGGLDAIFQRKNTDIEQFQQGLKIIHTLQGRGSGSDLAASLSGGLILFDPTLPRIQKLDKTLHFQLVYAGYKIPTAEVLQRVEAQWQNQRAIQNQLYQLMGHTTQAAYKAMEKNDLPQFYLLANSYQGLMDALGVNDKTLSNIVYDLRKLPGVGASKISGSGLGDCVLSFGQTDLSSFTESYNIEMTPTGLQVSAIDDSDAMHDFSAS